MKNEEILKVVDLSKSYNLSKLFGNSRSVLQDINFKLYENDILGIVGQSGAGKTTLSRLLLALEPATSGKIYYYKKDISEFSRAQLLEFRRNVQMLFQFPKDTFNPSFTILKSLMEPMRIHKNFCQYNKYQIKEYLELAELTSDVLNSYPDQLSGGQIQRLSLIRILLLKPKLIILDEPTTMLDSVVQKEIIMLLKRIQREFSLSYIFISHDLDLVRFMCDRVAILYNGKIIETGEVGEIFSNPTNSYTKQLINDFYSFA